MFSSLPPSLPRFAGPLLSSAVAPGGRALRGEEEGGGREGIPEEEDGERDQQEGGETGVRTASPVKLDRKIILGKSRLQWNSDICTYVVR